MSDYVDYIRLQIGGRSLDDIIESVTETSGRAVKAVNTMNRARIAQGYKRGNRSYELEIKAEDLVDPSLPDWEALKDTGALFTIVKVPSSGPSVTYAGVTISKVVRNAQDGDSTLTISAMALTRKES